MIGSSDRDDIVAQPLIMTAQALEKLRHWIFWRGEGSTLAVVPTDFVFLSCTDGCGSVPDLPRVSLAPEGKLMIDVVGLFLPDKIAKP